MNYHAKIEVEFSEDPFSRILAIEDLALAMCKEVGEDPADCIMILLAAAAHIGRQHSVYPQKTPDALAKCLAQAIIAVERFFPNDHPTPH